MTNEPSFDWTPLSQSFKTAADAASDIRQERSGEMRKLIVTEFISLDGVDRLEAPMTESEVRSLLA